MKRKEEIKHRAAGYIGLLMLVLVAFGSCRTPAGRTPGEVVDDATITTEVKARFFDESILGGIAISVNTFEGSVTLTGAVDNEEQRNRAELTARSVYGVRKVNDLLNVKKQ